jgi:hypothetical protein
LISAPTINAYPLAHSTPLRDADPGAQATLFEMILAANFLDIKPMLDLTCKTGKIL